VKPLTVKLAADDLARLDARAKAAGEKRSAHARRLLAAALRGAGDLDAARERPVTTPPAGPAVSAEVRKAVWALIVALSPDLDEDHALDFVRTYLDGPHDAVGYVPRAGGGP
jgi:hypothetical protein